MEFTRTTQKAWSLCLATLLVLVVVPASRALAIGEAGAAFLKIPVGARENAMGATGTVLATGATALRWNPAGLAAIESRRFEAMHGDWLASMSFQHFGVAAAMGGGVTGISILYSSSGDIPGYDAEFNPTGDFKAADLAVTLGWARPLGDNIKAGFGGTLIQQSIEEESATGFAADVGMRARIPAVTGLELGLAVRHLGPAITFIDESDPLPTTISFGASWCWREVVFAGEASRARGTDDIYRIGAEVSLLGSLALRSGYLSRSDMDGALTAGVGFVWHQFRLDYAFVPFNEIEDTHHVGIIVDF